MLYVINTRCAENDLINAWCVQLMCSFVLSRLDYCNATLAMSSCHSYHTPPENTKQCSQTCPPKIKTTTCHTASQTATLASDSNTHWLQTCNTCFSTLWWFSASVSLFNISAAPIAQIKQWQASQGSTLETEIFRVQVFQLPRTCRLELSSHWSQTLIFPVLL